jgi:flagellar hook-basal body complex protein FliE
MIEALSLTDFDVSSTLGTQSLRTQAVQGTQAIQGAQAIQGTQGIQGAAASSVGATDFGSVLASLARDTMSTMKGGEAAAISGIQGKASTQKVVEAIMSAEQALQVAISVRDKVVQAYQEIGRMAI